MTLCRRNKILYVLFATLANCCVRHKRFHAKGKPSRERSYLANVDQNDLFILDSTDRRPWLAMAMIVSVAIVVLNLEGRRWWCPAGDLSPWAWNIWSQHNSQHLIDPYSFTH